MIVGIDPGKSGGIAAVDMDGQFVRGMRTPLLKHGKRDLVDSAALDGFTAEDPAVIVIEQVSAMPGQGVSSMFNFGRHTGAVESWALTWQVPVQWVTPAKWKKDFSLTKDKRASLDRARLEFGSNPLWDVLANDGIAEAALIALWWLKSNRELG